MRILLMCLLFCVQSAWGAERYFASGIRLGWTNFHQKDDNDQLISSLSDPSGERVFPIGELDVTIGDDTITVHRARFLFDGKIESLSHEPPRTFELDGRSLQIFVDINIEDVTFPRWPEFFFPDGQPKPLESEPIDLSSIRIFGTYGDSEFDIRLSGEHPLNPSFHRYRLFVEFDEQGGLAVFNDWYKLDFFPFPLDLGNGVSLSMVSLRGGGRIPNYTDIQRVPSPEELAVLLPGDTDMNGNVEFSDFLKLSSKFGERGTWGHGDFNGDFNVDFADFLILADNFGSVRAQAAAVPEPGLVVLLLPAILLLRRLGGDQ